VAEEITQAALLSFPPTGILRLAHCRRGDGCDGTRRELLLL
jgi:hypothetical protein